MIEPLKIALVGPNPEFIGGIGSVLRELEGTGDGYVARIIATWEPTSRRRKLVVLVRAGIRLSRLSDDVVVHVHMAAGGSVVRKGLLIQWLSRRGHATLVTLHGSRFGETAERFPRLVRLSVCRANVLLVLSPEMRNIAHRLCPGSDIRLAANPVRVESAPEGVLERPRWVVFAGEVGRRKGVDVLLQAWQRVHDVVPDSQLHIMGPPGDVEVPEGFPGVVFRGELTRQEVREVLLQSRVAVLPSRAEALPMFLLEAMACATPIIGTDVGDVRRLTSTGAGSLIEAGDPVALAEAILRLLSDHGEAEAASSAGWLACQDLFSATAVRDQHLGYYRDARAASAARGQ